MKHGIKFPTCFLTSFSPAFNKIWWHAVVSLHKHTAQLTWRDNMWWTVSVMCGFSSYLVLSTLPDDWNMMLIKISYEGELILTLTRTASIKERVWKRFILFFHDVYLISCFFSIISESLTTTDHILSNFIQSLERVLLSLKDISTGVNDVPPTRKSRTNDHEFLSLLDCNPPLYKVANC